MQDMHTRNDTFDQSRRDPNPHSVIRTAVRHVIENGYAVVTTDTIVSQKIRLALGEAGEFFRQDTARKAMAASPEVLEGYRAMGREYSESADRPDLNESFSVWIKNATNPRIVDWARNVPLHSIMSEVLAMYQDFAADFLELLRQTLNPSAKPLVMPGVSYLQVNHYRPKNHSRDLLQDAHEDGHLITIVKSYVKGLQIKPRKDWEFVSLDEHEILFMPGSILTAMTGGIIRPLFHRVVNDKESEVRDSLMYFINPSLDTEQEVWVQSDENEGTSIRQMTIANSARFGLPSLASP